MSQSTMERPTGFMGDTIMSPARRQTDANRAASMALGILTQMRGDGQVGVDFPSPPEHRFATDAVIPPSDNIG